MTGLLIVLLILVVVVVAATAVGLSARGHKRTREIAEELGLPKPEEVPPLPEELPPPEVAAVPEPVAAEPGRPRLRDRLAKTRAVMGTWRRRSRIDDETWDELEESLVLADVGLPTTQRILEHVRTRADEARIDHPAVLLELVKREMTSELEADRTLHLAAGEPNVWLFVGVNGVGKTTSIAKLAQRQVEAGHKVVVAAADTFRAAAAEQLGHWAEKVGADIVRGAEGADPGSVVFDAMSAATNRQSDLVLVDTAGRLHSNVNLMAELEKVRRIIDRTPGACKEVLLVLDASTGQNGLAQAKQFTSAVDVTGVVLTKLDGTAKGGIVLAIQSELGIPVKVVGVGEGEHDLIDFDPREFVDALFD
ncbi:MAG: signal recognition particle-docking protein FtsY [Acidimicrobiia bacterium]